MKFENPWKINPWFESVAEAQRHLQVIARGWDDALAAQFSQEPGAAERGGLRAGFRTHDGRWSERELIAGYGWATAASDGTGFVVVTSYGTSGSQSIGPLTFDDESLHPTAEFGLFLMVS